MTKNVHFSYSSDTYTQTDGVAMDSLLGPVTGSIFMIELEVICPTWRERIVGALTSFLFNGFFLKKTFDMLSQFLLPYLTKKVNSYSLVLGEQPLITLQIQNFH